MSGAGNLSFTGNRIDGNTIAGNGDMCGGGLYILANSAQTISLSGNRFAGNLISSPSAGSSFVDCLQFDQPAVYDQPALAAKLRKHKVGLFSPCDIQKVLPTGVRALIERETRRLVETFRGGFIAKNYPDLHGIGVKSEWDQWAYEDFVRFGG